MNIANMINAAFSHKLDNPENLALLFILFAVAFPLLMRFSPFTGRKQLSFPCIFFGIAQELFIACLGLFLFIISRKSLFIFLCLSQGYLLLDATLYKKIKTRMSFSYFFYFKDLSSFRSSFKAEGGGLFLLQLCVLFGYNGLIFLLPEAAFPLWLIPIGLFCFFSLFFIPRERAYPLAHPLFLPFFRGPALKHSVSKPLPESAPAGPPLFTIAIEKEERPHILFLLMESFRAKDAAMAPHFFRLRSEGIFFSEFYANAVETKAAAFSALNGIPHFLATQGYQTAYFHNGHLDFAGQRSLLKQLHFDTLIGRNELLTHFPEAKGNSWGIYDEYLMVHAADWLERQRRPTFLTLATMTCHHPWTVPEHYKEGQATLHPYLQTLHYSDYALGLFVDRLRQKNLSKKVILFILGDHGQPLGEHGENFLPQNGLYQENVHVPLLILAEARLAKPEVISEIASQADLFATVQDLFLESKKSLRYSNPGRTAFFESGFKGGLYGCRSGVYKYIASPSFDEEELYDLSQDPEEKVNLALENPALAGDFRQRIQQHSFPKPFAAPSEENAFLLKPKEPLRITDKKLETMARHSPFQRADLKECLLLTDHGVQKLLGRCPDLEWVTLNGICDLTDRAFASLKPNLKMVRVDLLSCPKITSDGVHFLFQAFPNLQALSINCAAISSFPLKGSGQLVTLHIQQGRALTDDALIPFIDNNPTLRHLVLEECALLSDGFLERLKKSSLDFFHHTRQS
jgi:hypothetical protein